MGEIACQNGRICEFQGLVTLTVTLDRVILHTVMHHSSTSTYIPNFIQIQETFCGRTYGRADGHLRLTCWPWQTLGAIRAVATVWQGAETTHNFTDFPSDNFHEFCTQQRRSVSRCKLSKENFDNFVIRGRFSKHFSKIFQFLTT